MNPPDFDRFCAALTHLEGEVCWSFIAGKGTGSRVSFDFGAKIPRKTKIANPHLSEEQNTHRGDISLFLEDCVWSVENSQGVLCDSEDDNSPDGPMLRGLGQLVGKKVESVELWLPGFDLQVEFENDLKLLISCVEDSSPEYPEMYCYFYADEAFGVEAKGVLSIETR